MPRVYWMEVKSEFLKLLRLRVYSMSTLLFPLMFYCFFGLAMGRDKAPVDTPRRAMGHLLGHGVRFGLATDVMAAGEGLETMLSLRSALPTLPVLAALSANHLAAILFPATLRRLYVARDRDSAGGLAVATLTERAQSAGIEALTLTPALGDFNEDLRQFGVDELRAVLRIQLAPDDVPRFLLSIGAAGPGR